jgi:hypothetical protein
LGDGLWFIQGLFVRYADNSIPPLRKPSLALRVILGDFGKAVDAAVDLDHEP